MVMTHKRAKRRTKREMERLRCEIYETAKKHQPLTLRNLFYLLVVRHIIEKTQKAYKNDVIRVSGGMRTRGEMPYSWFADNTRWMREPRSYASLADMLRNSQETYRRDLWGNQDRYVEVWVESDSAVGFIIDVTEKWDVPLMPARGFSSHTFVNLTVEAIKRQRKPTKIIYLGDYDPSGMCIHRDIERKPAARAPDADIEFKRIAVTPEQIATYNLPGRPPKATDSRIKSFKGEAVEVEAFPPAILKQIVDDEITKDIDKDRLEKLRTVEAAERETLYRIVFEHEHEHEEEEREQEIEPRVITYTEAQFKRAEQHVRRLFKNREKLNSDEFFASFDFDDDDIVLIAEKLVEWEIPSPFPAIGRLKEN